MRTRKYKEPTEFYKIGYYLGDDLRYAVYFSMESAQEAMMKMLRQGTNVTGMESDTL